MNDTDTREIELDIPQQTPVPKAGKSRSRRIVAIAKSVTAGVTGLASYVVLRKAHAPFQPATGWAEASGATGYFCGWLMSRGILRVEAGENQEAAKQLRKEGKLGPAADKMLKSAALLEGGTNPGDAAKHLVSALRFVLNSPELFAPSLSIGESYLDKFIERLHVLASNDKAAVALVREVIQQPLPRLNASATAEVYEAIIPHAARVRDKYFETAFFGKSPRQVDALESLRELFFRMGKSEPALGARLLLALGEAQQTIGNPSAADHTFHLLEQNAAMSVLFGDVDPKELLGYRKVASSYRTTMRRKGELVSPVRISEPVGL